MVDQESVMQKNKILAGLAYLFLFLSWIGLIADLVIYYSTKNKYAKFHAGQACFLVLVLNIIMLVVFFGVFGTFSLMPMGLPSSTSVYSSIFIVGVVVALLYISLAIAAFMGKDFRIPIAAHLLEK